MLWLSKDDKNTTEISFVTLAPGGNVLKPVFFVANATAKKARVFFPDNILQTSLIYLTVQTPWVGSWPYPQL
jgi:hypothetical protein